MSPPGRHRLYENYGQARSHGKFGNGRGAHVRVAGASGDLFRRLRALDRLLNGAEHRAAVVVEHLQADNVAELHERGLRLAGIE